MAQFIKSFGGYPHHQVMLAYIVAFRNEDFLYGSGNWNGYAVEHLHRLKHEQQLSCFYFLAFVHGYLHDGARKGRENFAGLGLVPYLAVLVLVCQQRLILPGCYDKVHILVVLNNLYCAVGD